MSHDQTSKQTASTQITTLLSLKIIYKLRPIESSRRPDLLHTNIRMRNAKFEIF